MSSDRVTLVDYGARVDRQRPKRDPSRDTTEPSDDTDATSLEDYGGEVERTHVPDDELEGAASSEELHAAADAADTILDVSRELRIGYHDARHDLDQIGRKEELAKGKSLAQKLRGQQ